MEPEVDTSYETMDPVVLYDIFYETGNYCIGVLVALGYQAKRQGNMELKSQLFEKRIVVEEERMKVDPDDPAAQIAHIEKWRALAAEARKDIIREDRG